MTGSDTMVGLAAAWAETFHDERPEVMLQVKGGGSGVGIAALCAGKIDIATASRPMKAKEIERARVNSGGRTPKEFIVGRDALAVYVHQDNPIESITLADLAEIYGEGGTITRWDQLGIDNPACRDGEIIRVSRQNSSGTYAYFQEAVLGKKRQYKQGATSQSGSSDVVALISNTPCAIGYSGMGYLNPRVKTIKIAKEKGSFAVEPTVETTVDGSYPISRPLYLYTLGEPTGLLQEFIQWVLGPDGQRVVEKGGYVPVNRKMAAGPASSDSAPSTALQTASSFAMAADATQIATAPRYSGGRLSLIRRLPEMVVEGLIRICGWSAIIFVFGIFFFVLREGAPLLFGGLNLREFFFSSDWNPVAETPHFGILGLLAGTASVTVLAMAIAVPLGLGLPCMSRNSPRRR